MHRGSGAFMSLTPKMHPLGRAIDENVSTHYNPNTCRVSRNLVDTNPKSHGQEMHQPTIAPVEINSPDGKPVIAFAKPKEFANWLRKNHRSTKVCGFSFTKLPVLSKYHLRGGSRCRVVLWLDRWSGEERQ